MKKLLSNIIYYPIQILGIVVWGIVSIVFYAAGLIFILCISILIIATFIVLIPIGLLVSGIILILIKLKII